ncbi:MAG: RHS repeat-associated core domain-containing protein [Pseudomonadota bacterium]
MLKIIRVWVLVIAGLAVVVPSAWADNVHYDKIIVYGSSTCYYTSLLQTFLIEHGVQYTYKDIDKHAGALSEMWAVVENASWYGGGSVSTPIVEVNGTAFEQPDPAAVLALLGTGNGIVSSADTGVCVGNVKIGTGEAVKAEIDLVRISSTEEFWQVCSSNTQGDFSCHGLKPGEYRVVVRRNTAIGNKSFLNSFVQAGNIFTLAAGGSVNTGLTTVNDFQIEADAILPFSYVRDVYWGSPGSNAPNYMYVLTYGDLWSMNTADSSYRNLVNDTGYMNALKYSPAKKIIATLSQSSKKMYVVDADPQSATFHTVLRVVENLPLQPIKIAINSSGDMAYVACNGGQSVAVINLNTGTLITTIALSGFTQDIVLDELHKLAYAGVYSGLLSPAFQLAVIDLDPASPTYRTVLRYVPIVSDGCFQQFVMYPYVYSSSRTGIDRIDVTTNAVSTVIPTNNLPYYAISRKNSCVYFIDYDDTVLKNFQVKVFDLNKAEVIQAAYLSVRPTDAYGYYIISLADDESSVVVSNGLQKVYSFPINIDGTFGPCGGINKPTISDNGDDTYTITVTLSEPLPDNTYVAINFDNQNGGWLLQTEPGGHIPATCSGTTCTAIRHLDYPGIRYFRAGIFDTTTDVLQGCYSQSSTCTEQSCIDAVIKKNEIGDPAQSGSGSQLLRGVDVATGNFHQSATDLSVSGKGPDFTLTRAYNSRGGATRSGKWSFNLEAVVRLDAFNIMTVEYREDGRPQHFYKEMDGKWYPLNPGNFDELVRQGDGSVTLYTKGNLLYRFADPAGSSAGRLERIEDRDTNALVFSHTSNRITGATDASGRHYTITRDGSGRISSASDFAGRSVTYTWNADNMIVTATNPLSNSTTYGYSATRMTTITDPRTNLQATIEYYTALADDDFGRVKSVTDGLGNAWGYQYGIDNVYSNNLPSTGVTRPAINGVNNNIIFHVDTARTRVLDKIDSIDGANYYRSTNSFRAVASNKRIAEMALIERRVKPSTASTIMGYNDDGKGNRTRITRQGTTDDPQSMTAEAQRLPVSDSQPNLTPLTSLTKPGVANPTLYRVFTPSGKASEIEDPLNHISYRQYDAGLLKQSTDARGNSTGITYDANGYPAQVTDALGHVTITHYDNLGRLTSQQNARGFTTTTTYDANGNVLTITNPAGGVTTNTYDANDNLVTKEDPRGNTTTYVYDTLNRKIEEQYTVGGQQRVRGFAYDAMGRLYRQTNEKGHTSESRFNARDMVLQEIDPMSEAITFTYDANGNMLTETDAEGRVVTYTYDALDRKKQVTDALGNYEAFTYNTQGLLATKRDGRGKVTSYEYDGLGHMTKVTDADGGITRATYDANGNLATTVDRKGQANTYTYDALNRLTLLTDAANRQWSFTYDEGGNMLTRTMPSGQTITYTYDNLDRVSGVSYPGGPTVNYTYDANGNSLTMTDANGTTTSTYDERNRMTGITNAFGLAVGYGYDAAGLLQQLTYPGNKIVSYVHDDDGRLTSLTDWLSQTTTYTRDGSGMVRAIQYGNGAKVAKDYDAVGRMVSLINRNAANAVISSHTLTLDGAGNPIAAAMDLPLLLDNVGKTAAMIYDASNRLASVDGTAITHDTNGRMTGDPSGVDPIQYAYNSQDLITTVTIDGALTDSYTYDGEGRRIARLNGSQTIRYLLDPTGGDLYRVLAETDSSNAIQHYYIYGDGLVAQISGTDHRYYHFDPSGNTLALSGNSGIVTDSYAYEPFGNATVQGSSYNPFRFVGQHGVMDDGNGLQYMRARYYRPDLRRFVSQDALHGEVNDPLSLNRYQYVSGNPMVGMDPSGMVPQWMSEWGDAIIATAPWTLYKETSLGKTLQENSPFRMLSDKVVESYDDYLDKYAMTVDAYKAGSINRVEASALLVGDYAIIASDFIGLTDISVYTEEGANQMIDLFSSNPETTKMLKRTNKAIHFIFKIRKIVSSLSDVNRSKDMINRTNKLLSDAYVAGGESLYVSNSAFLWETIVENKKIYSAAYVESLRNMFDELNEFVKTIKKNK